MHLERLYYELTYIPSNLCSFSSILIFWFTRSWFRESTPFSFAFPFLMLDGHATNLCTVSQERSIWCIFFNEATWKPCLEEPWLPFPGLGSCCVEGLSASCRFSPAAVSFIISLYCLYAGNKVGVIKLECGRHVRLPRFPCHVGKPQSSWFMPLCIFNLLC